MAKRLDIDAWEEEFIRLFVAKVDEEPLYDYIHLYRKGLSPAEAVTAYLQENPDYAEKLEDLAEPAPVEPLPPLTPEEFLRKARELEARAAARQRLSEFCPECARRMGSKKICKCGYKRPKGG
ncbi:MAG: hypothetical protein OZSIB_2978 [Candidatus Ozemobacter sibiricus]|jgi:hypothetical protein|uniref:Uncharacterized protein n=1 Tax=Candidatus Ozemobacter sibiricus TaxID=2268124 RepID=A0A367ZR96_9BACT|nr:MAG: hypothetical protein OZSIB_2978 [Candidatus Ozemobacter sibiricus]